MRYSYGVAFLGALAYSTTVVGLPLDFGNDDLAVRDVNDALELDARMIDDFDVDAREIDFDVEARDVDFEEVYGRNNLGGTSPSPDTLGDPLQGGVGGGVGGDLGGGVVGGPTSRPGTVRTGIAAVAMGESKAAVLGNVVAGTRQRVGNSLGRSVSRRIGGVQRSQTWSPGRRDIGFEEFDRRQGFGAPGMDPLGGAPGGAPGGIPGDPMSGSMAPPLGDPMGSMGGSMASDPTMGTGGAGGYLGKKPKKSRLRSAKNFLKYTVLGKKVPQGYARRSLDQVTSGPPGSQGPVSGGLSSPPPGQGLSSPPSGQGLPPANGPSIPSGDSLPPPAPPVLGAAQPGQAQGPSGVKRKRSGKNRRSKKRRTSLSVPAQPAHGGNGGSPLPHNPTLGSGGSPLPNNPPLGTGGSPLPNNQPLGTGGSPLPKNPSAQQFRRSSWFLDELD